MSLADVSIEFEIEDDAADHAGLHPVGDSSDSDATVTADTDSSGAAQVEVTRDNPEGEEHWLEDGLEATIEGTSIQANVEIEWVEPEDADDTD